MTNNSFAVNFPACKKIIITALIFSVFIASMTVIIQEQTWTTIWIKLGIQILSMIGIIIIMYLMFQRLVSDQLNEIGEQIQHLVVKTMESESRLKNTQKIAHLGSWEYDLKSESLIWSDEAYQIFGLPLGTEITFDIFLELVYPDDRQAVYKAYTDSINNNKTSYQIEHRIIQKSTGELRHVYEKCEHVRNKNNKVILSLGMVHDITERKNYLDTIHFQQQEKQQIIDSIQDAVLTFNATGICLSCNKSSAKMFAYQHNEIINQPVEKLINKMDIDKYHFHLSNIIFSEKNKSHFQILQIKGLKQNNETFPMLLTISELPTDEEKERLLVMTCHDLTQQMSQEEQLRRSQKMDALGKLTAGLAHDYNNLLGVILGYSELLSNITTDNKTIQKYIEKINTAGERGKLLTQKLLTYSLPKEDGLEVVNINQLIKENTNLVKQLNNSKININYHLDEILWPAFMDRQGFLDAIENILINAKQAILDAGEIQIITTNKTLNNNEAIKLNLISGDFIKLTIIDNGVGMDIATKEQMFDPFFTTKGNNFNGLGMLQVYNLIHNSKGKIVVDSEQGKGTKIDIYIPRQQQNNFSPSKHKSTKVEKNKDDVSILVVDDEPALCALAKDILEINHYQVDTAADGLSAIKMLETKQYDLVISDIIMPNMGGIELTKVIQKDYPNTHIMLVSGYNEIDSDDKIKESLSAIKIMSKPYNKDNLLENVGNYFL
ncbi:MAG: response regulator [Gammaproteobacteria bacterium]|nr:response regulator [Gammaproteobacteria bacterium]